MKRGHVFVVLVLRIVFEVYSFSFVDPVLQPFDASDVGALPEDPFHVQGMCLEELD